MAIKDDMEDIQEAVINELITENGITNTLADGQVIEAKIADNAVTTAKIADGSVTAAKLGSDVDLDLADNEVTTAKINNGAVTLTKLGGDVDLGQVNDGAVTTAKIADDAVTPAKLDRAYLESTGGIVSGALKISASSVVTASADADDFVIEKTGDTGLSILSTTTGRIYFGDATNDDAGSIRYVHSDNSMRFETNDTERMRIESGGAVVVKGSDNGDSILRLTATSGSDACYLNFGDDADGDVGQIAYIHGSNYMRFKTNDAERMRIDSNGHILINQVSSSTPGYNNTNIGASFEHLGSNGSALFISRAANPAVFLNRNADGQILNFRRSGIGIGGVDVTTSSVTYATSSDYRLKEDVIEMEGSLDRLKALKPYNFRWKSDGTRVDGFLAHEAQEVVPEAVTGTKDAMTTEEYEVVPAVLDDEGNEVTPAEMGTLEVPDYQGIDQSKLVPLLTKALQEAVAKIEALEARVEALENIE